LKAVIPREKTVIEYSADRTLFSQTDPEDSVFYLRRGKVKVAATSKQGKEAIVAILDAGEFFGGGCLAEGLERELFKDLCDPSV
jgi:CRP/FNR family transcriptional regulator, cyclic AMP receptor protein